MLYFLMTPKDRANRLWIFHQEIPVVRLFPQYLPLVCQNCGKFSEDDALKLGVDAAVTIKSRHDFLETEDGVTCVSKKCVESLNALNIPGLDLLAVPRSDFFILRAKIVAPTDFERAGLEVRDPEPVYGEFENLPRLADQDKRCVACRRHFLTLFFPRMSAMKLPDDPRSIFTTSISMEQMWGRNSCLWCSEVLAKDFRGKGLKGLEFTPARP